MIAAGQDPLGSLNNQPVANRGEQPDIVQRLLAEIVRVKELIKNYEEIPDGLGRFGAAILTELVAEAYSSLVDYDTELMKKYYDLLQHCD